MSRKALVLDANILIRAVLGHTVRSLVTTHCDRVDFFTPTVCFDDARTYLPPLLTKRGVSVEPALALLDRLERIVQAIEHEWLQDFEIPARLRLRRRDEADWPILAAAMALECPIWTEDSDFFGTGIATWTTANVCHFFET
jgi:predicted nucleic acid-binding protein